MPAQSRSPRAGQYLPQVGGYLAFRPARLPPNPAVAFDSELLELLSKADRAIGRLDAVSETLPNPDMFVLMYVRKEAVLSSQIEGTQASLADVLEFEAELRDPDTTDAPEVINYVTAMRHGLDRLSTLPVSLRLISEIHQRLLLDVRGGNRQPGEFRKEQNWIGPENCTLQDAVFVPPHPDDVPDALRDLERFVHDPAPMPLLVKIALVHAQFETIHPFYDGNGRVGRLLITFLLCEREVLRRPLLYLSHYFKKRRTEYYDRLQAVRDDGNWEQWVKFFLAGVFEVGQEAFETARKIVRLRENHRALIGERLDRKGAGALALLEKLYDRPYVSVRSVESIQGLSFSNANALVADLCDLGILQELTGRKRNRLFCYDAYMNLLEHDETP
jgi:Fic family protein